MKTRKTWISAVWGGVLGGGLVLGVLLSGPPAGRAQPEEQVPAQQEKAAPAKTPEKPARLAAQAREKQRMATQLKLAEISSPPVIEIHDPFIFVIKGRTLYQFDLQTLDLLHWAALDPPEVLTKKARLEQKKAEGQTLQVK